MEIRKSSNEKMRLTLICPPTLAVLEPWQDTPTFGRAALSNLAGYLRQFDDFEIRLIDAKFERLGFEDVLARISDFKPHLVGFSAYTNEIKPAAYQNALIKKHFPDIISVIGGVHLTSIPEQTMNEFQTFDIGVIGEGEFTLHELCVALLRGSELDSINGLIFRNGSKLIKTSPRERNVDLDALPLPAWDLLPPADTYYIQTERGCPFGCVFCVNPNGKVARKRSVGSIIEEMELLIKNYKPGHINFGDELFTVDVNRTHLLLDEMIKRGIGNKIKWDCQTHVRYVDYNLLKKMKEANAYEVYMGVETGDEERLKKMGKGTTREIIIKSFAAAHRANIRTGAFFIFGHPNETRKSIFKTIKLAGLLNPKVPVFGLMVPYPATEVARLSARNEAGYLNVSTDWDDYRWRANGAIQLEKITRRQLDFFIALGYLYIFIANYRFLDLLRFFFKENFNVWILVKRFLYGVDKTSEVLYKPLDYDDTFKNTIKITKAEVVDAKENFDRIQKNEIRSIREARPQLVMEQKMI